jgi:hypothetical protein
MDAHRQVANIVSEIMSEDASRIRFMQNVLSLYRHRSSKGYGIQNLPRELRTARNTLRSVTKTIHSRLIAMKAIPFYCSDSGDSELRHRLEGLNKAVAGLYLSTGFEDRYASLWCETGILLGTSFLKAYPKAGRVKLERVMPWEVFYDPLDAYYGEPRCMYQVRWVDKAALQDAYPQMKYRDAVNGAGTSRPEWAWWTRSIHEPVCVIEAWRLGDEEEGEKGRHVVCTAGGTFVDEEYDGSDFDIVPFHYDECLEGPWADGVGSSLFGRQMEINRITRAIRETIVRLGWPKMILPEGGSISEAQLNNTPGAILNVTGSGVPVIMSPPPLTREPVQYLSDLVASCFEDEGVSQYAAMGAKPAGVYSGRAIRLVADQQDGRLRGAGESWVAARARLGAAMIRAQRRAAKDNPDTELVFTSAKKRESHAIKWKDIDLPDTSLQLVQQPVSSLPGTPGARAALLDELYNNGTGVITLDEYRDGIDLPDVSALTEGEKAPRRAIEKILDTMVLNGQYTPPEPFFPMALARKLGLQRYSIEYLNDTPEPIMGLLRRWCLECKEREIQAATADTMAAENVAANLQMQAQAAAAAQQEQMAAIAPDELAAEETVEAVDEGAMEGATTQEEV